MIVNILKYYVYTQETKFKEAAGFYESIVKKHFDNVSFSTCTCTCTLYACTCTLSCLYHAHTSLCVNMVFIHALCF